MRQGTLLPIPSTIYEKLTAHLKARSSRQYRRYLISQIPNRRNALPFRA